MLRFRLISGSALALSIAGLLILDAYLASLAPPDWNLLGLDAGRCLYNGLPTTLIVLVLTLLSTRELTLFARAQGCRPLRFEAYFFAAGLVIGPYLSFNLPAESRLHDEAWGLLWVSLAVAYAFLAQAARRGIEGVLINVSTTVFIVSYAGGFAGYLPKLRMEVGGSAGAVVTLFSVFVVKMTDVGAFFLGMCFGRTPLIPWLSPKKTWEGLVGGVLVALLSALGVGAILTHCDLLPRARDLSSSLMPLALFGLLMAGFSIAGDLAESLLKRDARLKDSGDTFPGLGGVLDVFDSPLLAAPVAWFFWTRLDPLLGGAPS